MNRKIIYINEKQFKALSDFYKNDKFKLGYEGDATSYAHIVNENQEDEINAKDISLNSFKPKDSLNPKIWENNKLKSKIRRKLLKIAENFWNGLEIKWASPKDYILTGSICNYNWSKYSDIDLHILIDYSKIDKRTDFVKEFFNSVKNEYNQKHKELTIMGYPIELYVQDTKEENASTGVYSLNKNEWIKEPDKNNFNDFVADDKRTKEKSAKVMTLIDDIYDKYKKEKDIKKINKMYLRAKHLKDKIVNGRRTGLSKNGELDINNICFKIYRRSGHLEKLSNMITSMEDKINSY